jgi:hypothetical protein
MRARCVGGAGCSPVCDELEPDLHLAPVRRRDQIGVAGAGEQLELLWCWSAWHRHLPESPLGSSMLRSNLAFAMRHRERRPHRAAMPPELAKQPLRQPASPRLASIGRPPDRTSRREPPAVGRTRHRSGYSEKQPSLPSRSHREREQLAPPKGAKGRAPRAPRSRGRSVMSCTTPALKISPAHSIGAVQTMKTNNLLSVSRLNNAPRSAVRVGLGFSASFPP